MNLTKIFVLLLTFILLNQIYAGDSLKIKNARIWDEVVYDTKVFISDGAAIYSAPFRFNSKEWLYTGAGIVSMGIIVSQDRNLKASLSKGDKSRDIWSYVKSYGDVKYAGIGSGIIYLTGLVFRSKIIRETGRMLLQSLVYSGSITILLKIVTGRSRPYYSESQYDFNWFEKGEDKLSFPSGHSTVAFAISTVLAEKIDTWWSRAGFYSLAALTAYSRVHDNQHWVSDAVFGSLIGFGSGYFVVHVNNDRNKKQKFSFSPTLNGIAFQYKF